MHYIIGDIQGCYDELRALLKIIHYQPHQDQLWFCGDLVNRGPKSLDVLKFVTDLPSAIVVLGNHDLHLLRLSLELQTPEPDDSLMAVLESAELSSYCQWLRTRPFMHVDLGVVLVHAGVAPQWELSKALECAQEVSTVLSGPHYLDYLAHLYSDEPSLWTPDLKEQDRLRFITNCFTRIRFCDKSGRLYLAFKGEIGSQPASLMPWFEVPHRKMQNTPIVFGHWSALSGKMHGPNLYALDTGCVWGGSLTAMCIETKKRYHTPCPPQIMTKQDI